jgi:hypothetical protein
MIKAKQVSRLILFAFFCSVLSCNKPESEFYTVEQLRKIINLNSEGKTSCKGIDWETNSDMKLTHSFGKLTGHIYNIGYDIDSTGHFNSSVPLNDKRYEKSLTNVLEIIDQGDSKNNYSKSSMLPMVRAQIFDIGTLMRLRTHPNYLYIRPYVGQFYTARVDHAYAREA